MKPITRYFAAAAGVDCATYIAFTGVPFLALKLGATSFVLGLLPAAFSVVYVSGTLLMGRWSDRLSRRVARITLARVGVLLFAAAALILLLAKTLSSIFLAMALAAIGLSLFWPALQAGLAEADAPQRLSRNLGRFNISWSLGKGTGFALGGLILSRFGFAALFIGAVVLALAVAAGLRSAPPHADTDADAAADPDAAVATVAAVAGASSASDRRHGPDVRRGFLRMAWIANALAYGVVATLNYHYPKYLDSLGRGASLYGAFQALVYLAETGTFLVLRRYPLWHYRTGPLFASQALLALFVLAIPFLRTPALFLLLAPGIGAVIGLSYYSSLYYSLHAAEARGKNTGLHEAVLGSGSLVVPMIGGGLATATGNLAAPYLVCSILLCLGLVAQAGLARTMRFRTGARSANI